MLKVTYIRHSSFLVETDRSYLLFDYWTGTIPPLSYDKELYVFVSHAHHDHYSKDIYKLEAKCKKVTYILSFDVKNAGSFWKQAEYVEFFEAHEEKKVGECLISTLRSTDEGVAFLIKLPGLTIYHAGDLHWWEWPGDPEDYNRMMGDDYKREIDRIKDEKIDLAFVVLDPRQDASGGLGLAHFLKNVKAGHVFPMHFWEDYGLITRFISENRSALNTDSLVVIEKPGQTFALQNS